MPGADDNASGTAAVVELARLFAGAAVKPRRTIVFAALAAEGGSRPLGVVLKYQDDVQRIQGALARDLAKQAYATRH